MKKTCYLISIVLLGVLNAQTLSMDECVHKALNVHPDIKRFALQVQYSKQGVNAARSDYLPHVTLSGEYNPTKTYTMPQNGEFIANESHGWSAGVVLEQKIWDFSKTTSDIKAQQIQEEISALGLEDVKAFLAYEVKLQYELMMIQREAIRIRQKDLNAKEELYKQAQALLCNGLKIENKTIVFEPAI